MMSISSFLMSEGPKTGALGGKFAETPSDNRNIVQFHRLVIVLDDDARVVQVLTQSEREWIQAA